MLARLSLAATRVRAQAMKMFAFFPAGLPQDVWAQQLRRRIPSSLKSRGMTFPPKFKDRKPNEPQPTNPCVVAAVSSRCSAKPTGEVACGPLGNVRWTSNNHSIHHLLLRSGTTNRGWQTNRRYRHIHIGSVGRQLAQASAERSVFSGYVYALRNVLA